MPGKSIPGNVFVRPIDLSADQHGGFGGYGKSFSYGVHTLAGFRADADIFYGYT